MPSREPDNLLRSLNDVVDPAGARPWGTIKTSLLGAASFGILPLLLWPGRFRDRAGEEARQLNAVTEWVRSRGRAPAAIGPLRAAADDLRYRPLLWLLPLLMALFVIGVYVLDFNSSGYSWDRVLDTTYRRGHIAFARYWFHQPWSRWPVEQRMHLLWCAALSAGYLCHFAQVRSHNADVARFITRFNGVTAAHSLRPIPQPRIDGLINPIAIVSAIAFVHYGAWWGIPMLLAGAAEKRYTYSTSRITRSTLARRMRQMEVNRGPGALAIARCEIARCQAPLPPRARFCPRCGTRVSEAIVPTLA